MKKDYFKKTILSVALALLCVGFVNAQTETCPDGMIHYWPMDELGASGPYADLFGNDADCSSLAGTQCPVPVPGLDPIGASALNFFNADSYALDIPDDDTFDWAADESFTIEFWIRSDASSFTVNQVAVGRDARAGATGLHWWVGIEGNPGDGTSNDGTVRFQLRDTNDEPASPYLGGTGPKINDNVWHHIVAMRDESTNQNRIYVDAVLVDSETYDYTGGFTANAIMTVGYLFSTDPGATERFFIDAKIDELAIYSKALSTSEITTHYNTGANDKLGYCSIAPEFTSTPVTSAKIGTAYVYDVDVKANPDATFALENSPPSGMSIDAATGEITWTPTAGQEGTKSIRVRATNILGSQVQDFDINVSLENEPPTFTIGADQETTEDSDAQTVAAWATDLADGDGTSQVLTFTVTNNTNEDLFAAGPAVDGATGDLTYTGADDANGTATITIELSDAGGAVSAEQSFDITITPINDAPTFTTGADQTAENDAGLTIVQQWATDLDDGDPGASENQTLSFEIVSNNNVGLFTAGPTINAVGDLSFTPMEGTSGVASVTIALVDNGSGDAPNVNRSDEQTFNITITAPVGIDKENISKSLNVFPIPSSNDLINLRLENEIAGNFQIEVINLSGKSLYAESVQKRGSVFEHQIDVAGLPQGIFVLRILNDKFVAEKRIIID